MAKVKNPLHSFEATGSIGRTQTYLKRNRQNLAKATYRRIRTTPIVQKRQQQVISYTGALQRTRYKDITPLTYPELVRSNSDIGIFFWFDDVILDWSYLNLMTINRTI